MYVCHCRAVTDATIQQVIAGGARTIADVANECLAGTQCGGCWPVLTELLARIEASVDAAGHESVIVAAQ
jgi:bacterioferritin-associated ferredoxin